MWRLLLLPAIAVAVICQLTLGGAAGAATAKTATNAKNTTNPTKGTSVATGAVAPNPANELDCNGWSAKYKTVRKLAGDLCTDPVKIKNGRASRFIDNGWYIGHDEPSVKFISTTAGSGNTMSYLMRVPKSPAAAPTPSGSVTNYGELSVAPWFGLPICDPKSFPQNPCTPDSDRNSGLASDPNAAGSAFMELQFYPPGYTPFIDSESCSPTKWCSAMNIDSLECTFSGTCNNNCIEPVNFAFLQTNGVPSGPPSPQLTDVSTFVPNAHTLMINSGDVLAVSISDPPQGFTTVVRDLTTHQTGFMTASAANGFMNTNISDCSGTPFTFHAEYSSASIQNQVPWAALEGGVLMQQEIGHGEVCNSLANNLPVSDSFPGGQTYSDPSVFDTCVGGSEGAGKTGEGPCNPSTAVCVNPVTQTGAACPTNSAASGVPCEYSDGFCFPQGARTALVNGVPTREVSAANFCFNSRFQNGDLDFDGTPYQSFTWPDGTRNHPQSFEYIGPFQASGHPYPTVQYETDVAGSEILCNTATGAGCTAPPIGANFYPFWSLGSVTGLGGHESGVKGGSLGVCVWNFGNVLPTTRHTFGKDAQYGAPDVARFGGTLTSAPLPNPQFASAC